MDIGAFQEMILSFYAGEKRDLPWRKTTDPYKIIVSEVMLQQTQVDRVIPYFEKWIARWPTFSDLAQAEKSEVLAYWSGLGYNSRPIRLQKLAQEIVERGDFPTERDDLLKLPGIGPYTAGAVLAFAFNLDVPCVDTNIRRVLIHELGLPEDISAKELEQVALDCVPPGRSREWYNALMDYGAMVKTARKTGIRPTSCQSKFEGSSRQIRGKVLRFLLAKKKANYDSLMKHVEDVRLDDVLLGMIKDGVVEESNGEFTL